MKESPSDARSGRNLPEDSRPSGLLVTSLVGGVLLLLGALLFIELAPVLDCPECQGGSLGVFTLQEPAAGSVVAGCPTCQGKKRVTLVKRWQYQKAEGAP